MNDGNVEEVRDFWNRTAKDWGTQIGDEGDTNRILNSDPVLWEFAGDVRGLRVLDAGCGTGYLSKKLHDRGALVTGIDLSDEMIEIARTKHPELEFRVDSCSELRTIDDARFDMVISNYVLMDAPDLPGAVRAFSRVLKDDGVAVLVFSHPCFPQGSAKVSRNGAKISYSWSFPYFERRKCADPPWAHFKSEFPWFHRPLSDYWKEFTAAGFVVAGFEEPRITDDRYHLAQNETKLQNSRTRPNSVAFKLQKKR